MFLCPECHEKSGCEFPHMFKSRGRCERCGQMADCVDCKTYKQEVTGKPNKHGGAK